MMKDPLAGRLIADDLVEEVGAELRAIAARYLSNERIGHTFQPTALVHEAWIRIADQSKTEWKNAAQFRAVASIMMRRILIDHARQRNAQRRVGGAGGHAVTLSGLGDDETANPIDVIALDETLTRLHSMDPRQARIVEMRFFGGMTSEQVADHLDITTRTVQREWSSARAWLLAELLGE